MSFLLSKSPLSPKPQRGFFCLCHIWTSPVLQAGSPSDKERVCCHISGFVMVTFFVPSLDGFRAEAPMHFDGLMNQPMTELRVCSRGGDRFRPSVGISCYAILGSSSRYDTA